MWRCFALLLVASLAGCYRYSAARLDAIAPDEIIRVSLSPAGRQRVDSVLAANPWLSAGSLLTSGPQRLEVITDGALEGRLVEPVRETLEVNLQHANAGDRLIVIPRDQVSGVVRRELDVIRTSIFVVGGFSLVVLAFGQLHLGGRAGASGNQPPPSDPYPLRLPLSFSFGGK